MFSLPLPQHSCSVFQSIAMHVLFESIWSVIKRTRAVQPVATRRQSHYRHKPAIVKLLLLIDHTQPATDKALTFVTDNHVVLIVV